MNEEDSSKSTSSSCRMTRSELERLLKESEYGANELLFSAYFTRDQNGGGPPRCVVCQKLLGAHEEPSSSSSATQPNPVGAYGFLPTPHQQQPQPLPPAAALGTIIETDYYGEDETRAEAPSMIAALADTPPPPELKENYEKQGVDVVSTSIFGVMCLVGMVLAGVAVILLISFFASGLIANVPPVAAAPAGVLLIAFVFTYNTYGTHAEFDRNQRIVFYRKFWLYWCCCNTTVEVPFEQLSSQVELEDTNVRVNGVPIMNAVVKCHNAEQTVIVLEKGAGSDFAWQAYISRLKRGSTTATDTRGGGGGVAAATAVAGTPTMTMMMGRRRGGGNDDKDKTPIDTTDSSDGDNREPFRPTRRGPPRTRPANNRTVVVANSPPTAM